MITVNGSHYYLGGKPYPRVSYILGRARGAMFAGVNPQILAAALERGRAVHAAIELENHGALDEASVHPIVRPYLDSYRKWRDILKPTTESTERTMVSERYLYGGRMDWLCRLAGRYKGLWVVDVKSGEPNPADPLQTAAYWNMVVENDKPKGSVLRASLYVHRDGAAATFVPHTNPADLAIFLAYRAIHSWEETAYGTRKP